MSEDESQNVPMQNLHCSTPFLNIAQEDKSNINSLLRTNYMPDAQVWYLSGFSMMNSLLILLRVFKLLLTNNCKRDLAQTRK